MQAKTLFVRDGAWLVEQRVQTALDALSLLASLPFTLLILSGPSLVEQDFTRLAMRAFAVCAVAGLGIWSAVKLAAALRDRLAAPLTLSRHVSYRDSAFQHYRRRTQYRLWIGTVRLEVPLSLYENVRNGDLVEIHYKPHTPTLCRLDLVERGNEWGGE